MSSCLALAGNWRSSARTSVQAPSPRRQRVKGTNATGHCSRIERTFWTRGARGFGEP